MYIHDLSPFLLRFTQDFGLRWYGLSYLAGFVFAYFFIYWISQRQQKGFSTDLVGDFVTAGAIGVLIGGRLGYCIFYSPDLFIQFKSSFPFWGVLAVNEGGMASHGGIIGLFLATTWFAFKRNIPKLYLYDLISMVGVVGIFFGRIANFINGELVGRVAPETARFLVKFPQDILTWPSQEPEKLIQLQGILHLLPNSNPQIFSDWIQKLSSSPEARVGVNSTLFQIIDSIQNGNLALKEALGPFLLARYPSQIYAALGEGLFVFLILFAMAYKPQKPGVVGSWFVVIYAIARITTEQFRLPDAHIGFQALGLTRGQWLSIVMLIIGLVLVVYYGRREAIRTPGWGRGQHIRIGRGR